MRLSVFCGVSVDGFLARPDDTLDFLRTGEQEPHGFPEFLSTVDVVVMGRRTFEVVVQLGHLGVYGGKPMIVLTSRPLHYSVGANESVEPMSGRPSEIKEALTARGFQHAYVDGGITIQRFLAAGCIDRLVITRVPVLIGAGIPLFGPLPCDVPLRHVETRSFGAGLVQSEYTVTRGKPVSGQGA
jgi:dihydrofolate reductase